MKTTSDKNEISRATRVHESREDRSRTVSGKTANSKVRSEGRALAALERAAGCKHAYEASKARSRG